MKKEKIIEMLETSSQKRMELINQHLENGVIIPILDGVFIGENVKIAAGVVIMPSTLLLGETSIGAGSVVGANSVLHDTIVGENCSLNNVQAYSSEIGNGADLGPFVHIRPNTVLGENVHLGNFVEAKNSNIDDGTKVSHLTYVGDSDVGKNVNFGCGCVTVNYDGKNKHRTTIGDNCFIGCNTNLVAPVTVADFSYTAAGSTITDNVPEMSLAVARAKQVNKVDWVAEKKPYKNM
ncbi:MAG: DapH/DapD/GlmU-related protein [Clostridia bacterium]